MPPPTRCRGPQATVVCAARRRPHAATCPEPSSCVAAHAQLFALSHRHARVPPLICAAPCPAAPEEKK
uniref:Uncharacterized protein n=1 Tax=Arundo donax TaxID=35708 RepID=A0A0A9A275_ARUDO